MKQSFFYLIGYDRKFREAVNSGWGCGYVAIPEEHPYFKQKDPEESFHQVGGFSDEITYDEITIISGKVHWVLGFDTAHSWNTESHDLSWVRDKAIELKSLIDQYK